MNLNSILTQKDARVPTTQEHGTVYLHGAVEPDHDETMFRLYPDPSDRRSFFIIRREDVGGDFHEWSKEELIQAGFVGAKVFRVPLKHGTVVQSVSVKIQKIGVTISANVPNSRLRERVVGQCYDASDCYSGCCTTASDGNCYCDRCCYA